jgi:hypothetical protein
MSLFGKRKPVLFLHVGLNKTGTTAIQTTLASHREALKAAGLVYPTAGTVKDAHHELAWSCGFFQGAAPKVSRPVEDIVADWHREISATPGANGLVSSEFLCVPGEFERVAALLEGFELRVVVYLRRHDLWLPSVYAQAVKSTESPKWGRGYEAFLKHMNPKSKVGNFRFIVDSWAQHVGRKNVLVRPFEVAQIGDNVLHDLLRTIGATEAVRAVPETLPIVNASLSFEAMSFIDVVQHTTLPLPVKRHLSRTMANKDVGKTFAFTLASPGLRAGQIALHYDDYEYIANRYLERPDGRLFLDPTPADERTPWKPPAGFSYMWLTERLCEILGRGDDALLLALKTLGQEDGCPPSA